MDRNAANKLWHTKRKVMLSFSFSIPRLYENIHTYHRRFQWRNRRNLITRRTSLLLHITDTQPPREKLFYHRKGIISYWPHHKPSLISLQEPLILQVFSAYSWYLKQSLALFLQISTFLQITEKAGSYLMGKTNSCLTEKLVFPIHNISHELRW